MAWDSTLVLTHRELLGDAILLRSIDSTNYIEWTLLTHNELRINTAQIVKSTLINSWRERQVS